MPHQKVLESIHRAYFDASGAIAGRSEAEPENPKWEQASRYTDYAFYILLFAQLERYIVGAYEDREGVELSPENQPGFMHCVNVVFNQLSQKAQSIGEYYRLRNDIAHGKLVDGKSVNVSSYAQDFLRLMNEPPDPDSDAFYEKMFGEY